MKTLRSSFVTMLASVLVISCDNNDPRRTAGSGNTIETLAGTAFGYDGDGGAAKNAKLGYITGLSIDASGNLYVSDGASNTIRKINSSKEISTVAGKFIGFNVADPLQYSGDGGPATSAHLNVPLAVAIDPSGNLFVADAGNNVLRKVDGSNGNIVTIAGNVAQGSSGDNGPASQALINVPNGVATDAAGNLYFTDSQNHTVRKISTSGEITTIAGVAGEAGYSGDGGPAAAARLSAPTGIAIDHDGNIYISDNNSVIRRISMGKITTVAGMGEEGYAGDGGNATSAKFLAPKGIAIAIDGSILVADAGNHRIRRILPETGIIETIAGTGEAGYSGDGGAAVDAKLSNPQALAVDASGNIYVGESGSSVIRIIKPAN